jgi:SAM-dependent methyltransferase
VSLLFLVLALDSLIRGHDLPTSKQATKALVAVIQKYKPDAKNFYDLGCGRGTLLLKLKKILPWFNIYGIDNNTTRIFFAKLKNKILRRKVNFQTQDIFKVDLRDADIVYTYLWYDLMSTLEKKLRKELKQETIVITNTSHFHDWQPIEKVVTYSKISKISDFEILFVYIKK